MNARGCRSSSLLLRAWVALVSALLAVSGCGDDSKFATLTVELATESAASDCSVTRERELLREVVCLSFELCHRSSPTACEPVGLLRAGDDHDGAGVKVLRLERSTVFALDTAASGSDFELKVTGSGARGEVVAVGTTTGITIGAAVRVRLERTGSPPVWSCGPGTTAPRALHAATLLPNGQVLVYGGVGSDVDLNGAGGATLQRDIEVYDPVLQRFVPVTVNSTVWKGRVLFASKLVRGSVGGRYEIALYGGYEADDRAVLFLDAPQSDNVLGSPIVPSPDAMPGVPLRLLYDPATTTVTIVASPLDTDGAVVDTGFLALSDEVATGNVSALVLGAGAFTRPPPNTTTSFTPRAFWVDALGALAAGGATVLTTARMGATATPITEDSVFVWGGSVNEVDDVAARAMAGEILTRGEVSTPLRGGTMLDCMNPPPPPAIPTELPEPTVFHTATRFATGEILLAGGLLVSGSDCTRGISTLRPPHRPLAVVSFASDLSATAATVDAPGYNPTIFHTATLFGSGVVLVGGAAFPLRLESVKQVVRVARDAAGTFTYDASLPPMRAARWGHAATMLPGERLLVTGGFDTTAMPSTATALDWAEVLPLAPVPPAVPCVDTPLGDGGRPDAGPGDAGAARPDAGGADGGALDSGP